MISLQRSSNSNMKIDQNLSPRSLATWTYFSDWARL